MDYATYIDHLSTNGTAMAAVVARGLDRRVPTCPEWSVADLLLHAGKAFREITHIVRRGGTERPEPPDVSFPDALDPGQLTSWLRVGLDDLVDVLRSTDPEDAAYSWAGDHRAAFWARRMALETAVHRWDAENATGNAQAIDSDLGADGVEEMFDAHIPLDGTPYEGRRGSLHLHRTDGDGEWVVNLEPGALPFARRAHERCDVAARGTGSELVLLLWRRIAPADVEVFGDMGLLEEFWDYLKGPGE